MKLKSFTPLQRKLFIITILAFIYDVVVTITGAHIFPEHFHELNPLFSPFVNNIVLFAAVIIGAKCIVGAAIYLGVNYMNGNGLQKYGTATVATTAILNAGSMIFLTAASVFLLMS